MSNNFKCYIQELSSLSNRKILCKCCHICAVSKPPKANNSIYNYCVNILAEICMICFQFTLRLTERSWKLCKS